MPTQFKQMKKSDPINWSCPVCIDKPIKQGDVNSEYLSALPFAAVANLSTLVEDGFEGLDTSGHYGQSDRSNETVAGQHKQRCKNSALKCV